MSRQEWRRLLYGQKSADTAYDYGLQHLRHGSRVGQALHRVGLPTPTYSTIQTCAVGGLEHEPVPFTTEPCLPLLLHTCCRPQHPAIYTYPPAARYILTCGTADAPAGLSYTHNPNLTPPNQPLPPSQASPYRPSHYPNQFPPPNLTPHHASRLELDFPPS